MNRRKMNSGRQPCMCTIPHGTALKIYVSAIDIKVCLLFIHLLVGKKHLYIE